METTYRSYRGTGDPLGVLASITGVLGAACSTVLWFCQIRPANWLGSTAFEISHGGPLRDALVTAALFLGIVALVAGIPSALGTRGVRRGVPAGVLLALVALSYPVAATLHWV
jgi:hypothetical protein